jgi:4-nitrophenyl phosphatase
MDGVLWRGDRPMPGLAEFFAFLRRRPIPFILATNNASRLASSYAEKLAGYGIAVSSAEIITSAQATAEYLAERAEPGAPIYVVGMEGLRQTLAGRGFRLLDDAAEPGSAHYVVGSWDRHVSFDKLAAATLHIRAGATFIATNADRTWPGERGLLPGAGAILAALVAAADVEPTVIGKPAPTMLQIAMHRMGAEPASTAMLGDRLETDILGGQNAGLTTILVLSGVTQPADLETSPIQPDFVFENIAALTQAWRRMTKDG